MVEMPKETHLTEEKPVKAEHSHQEPVLSKVPHQGRQVKPEDAKPQESNDTQARPQYAPTAWAYCGFLSASNYPCLSPDRRYPCKCRYRFLMSPRTAE